MIGASNVDKMFVPSNGSRIVDNSVVLKVMEVDEADNDTNTAVESIVCPGGDIVIIERDPLVSSCIDVVTLVVVLVFIVNQEVGIIARTGFICSKGFEVVLDAGVTEKCEVTDNALLLFAMIDANVVVYKNVSVLGMEVVYDSNLISYLEGFLFVDNDSVTLYGSET